ncbi:MULTISPECIES: triose-phosphate isomerase [Mediterraneibacter]|uniref:triose-phosphate isomerase n=1 Tax=Mediterraneibacter TaxID=2316020 RepID=UPI0024AD7163|nr:triose-phosphate isomerase [Mediterraneibacter massiliensis]
MKKIIKTPVFGINSKAYMYGEALLELAKYADGLAKEYDMSIMFSAPYTDLANIASETKYIMLNAQGMDPIDVGRGMGHILPESLAEAGADGVFLNHVERPMTLSQLIKAVSRAKEVRMNTIILADSVQEARMTALLKPTMIICEQQKLIGTGKTADVEYMYNTKKAIKEICPEIIVLQGAGNRTAQDVYNAIKNGSEGSGASSGIFLSENPKAKIRELFDGALKAREEFGSKVYEEEEV